MPKDRLWTSMDEAEQVNSVIALPGGHHNRGAGRRWHFLTIIVWVLNGLTYVALLFATGEWRRVIPTSSSVFPEAWQSLLTYVSFQIPPESAFHPYDALQQLTYAGIVFLVAPLMIVTGACMSPALIARYPWYPRLFGGRQVARSLHFLGLVTLILYIIVHISLVLVVHFFHNIGNMVFGDPRFYPELGLVAIGTFHVGATRYTKAQQRGFQISGDQVLDPVIRYLLGRLRSRQHYTRADISPQHRVNGYPPVCEEYKALAREDFAGWTLHVGGLVERPLQLSLADLRALPKQEQITKHNCIQGWSGVAEWGGVRMTSIMDLCRPLAQARSVAFYAFMQEEYAPDHYYEVLTIQDISDPQSILAYEMNWKPLPTEHGAPCRLRLETKTGYKLVKYLTRIEFIENGRDVGMGYGGYREDRQYYDKVASI
jgi:methionine sulfoxide reductase catalytic subunit